MFLIQVPSTLASKKKRGAWQVAQLLGPGIGRQVLHGKRHWVHMFPWRLTLYPVAHLVQIGTVVFIASSPHDAQLRRGHGMQTPPLKKLYNWSPLTQSPHEFVPLQLMQPPKFGLVLSQVKQLAPFGDGLNKLASITQDAQTSGDEQSLQLVTLQLMHEPWFVNWNPGLQAWQDESPQVWQPGMVQLVWQPGMVQLVLQPGMVQLVLQPGMVQLVWFPPCKNRNFEISTYCSDAQAALYVNWNPSRHERHWLSWSQVAQFLEQLVLRHAEDPSVWYVSW